MQVLERVCAPARRRRCDAPASGDDVIRLDRRVLQAVTGPREARELGYARAKLSRAATDAREALFALLGLLDAVALRHDAQHRLFARFLDLAGDDELVKDLVRLLEVEDAALAIDVQVELAHVAKVAVEDLDVAVDDLERDQLVVVRRDARHKEERRIPPIHDLRVWVSGPVCAPLYSIKLHMRDCVSGAQRTLRASTSCVTSLTIFDLLFWLMVLYHFDMRTLPWREMSSAHWIWGVSRPRTAMVVTSETHLHLTGALDAAAAHGAYDGGGQRARAAGTARDRA